MKTTKYFEFVKKRSDRIEIKDAWIQRVMDNPEKEQAQKDGRIRLWGKIDEVGRYLRVVLLADRETVHNVFFDRNFRGDKS